MKHLRNIRRPVLLLAVLVALLLAAPVVTVAAVTAVTADSGTAGSGTARSATAGSGTAGAGTAGARTAGAGTAGSRTVASGTGWIRLAHLSPDTPAVDVYLYSFGNPDAKIVLHHVAYGDVSGFLPVPGGDYSVAMRAAGAAATSAPVLSSSTWVASGTAYTALAVGRRAGLRLRIFHDPLRTPAGKALVRVVQASLKRSQVTVSWDGKVIASELPFASVTSYKAVSPGKENVAAGDMKSAVTLTAGSIHTLIVLDGAKGLQIANLEDANGSKQMPRGGAETGFGGTAPRGPGSPLPWLAVIAGGSVLAAGGGLGLRHGRRGAGARHRLSAGA